MASKRRRSGNVIPFDGRIRGWKQLGIAEPYRSLDPNAPQAYLIEMQGQRSDDVVFTVKLALNKQKIDLIPTPEAVTKVIARAIQDLFTQLNSFRDCECKIETSCKDHQRQ